jgi:hypothetical protein
VTESTESRRTSPWLKIFGIGCGTVILAMFVGAGLLVWNWQSVSGVYHRARTTIEDLTQVQIALQDKYGGSVNVTANRRTGVEGSILGITLTNPSFMDTFNPDGAVGRQKALEVAAVARAALSPGETYDHYEIVFSRVRDASSTTSTYRVEAGDLPPLKTDKS